MKPRYLKKKFYVGVSGHRNLKLSKIGSYKEKLKSLLQKTIDKNSNKEVIIVSPLAEGADRLIVYAAKELGLRYEIILPMPIEYYESDFDDKSFDEFENLFYGARGSEFIDLHEGYTYQSIAKYGEERDNQYQKLGYKIVDRCDLMIFIWDRKINTLALVGGTEDIYNYAGAKNKSNHVIECERE